MQPRPDPNPDANPHPPTLTLTLTLTRTRTRTLTHLSPLTPTLTQPRPYLTLTLTLTQAAEERYSTLQEELDATRDQLIALQKAKVRLGCTPPLHLSPALSPTLSSLCTPLLTLTLIPTLRPLWSSAPSCHDPPATTLLLRPSWHRPLAPPPLPHLAYTWLAGAAPQSPSPTADNEKKHHNKTSILGKIDLDEGPGALEISEQIAIALKGHASRVLDLFREWSVHPPPGMHLPPTT